ILDLHNVSAKVGERHGTERSRDDAREVRDADAVEGRKGGRGHAGPLMWQWYRSGYSKGTNSKSGISAARRSKVAVAVHPASRFSAASRQSEKSALPDRKSA